MTKSEDRIQADCTTWAHNTYPHLRLNWWHVPNGGTRSIIEARKLKQWVLKPEYGIYIVTTIGNSQ